MENKDKVLILSFLILFSFVSVQAQAEPVLASISVDLWPEYDRSSMLVIYHMILSPEVVLPAELSVPIPAGAGSPHAVAIRQPDNSLITVPYTLERQKDWAVVVFQATAPEIQLEYYDPALIMQDTERSYTYYWSGNYTVEAFTIVVQQPKTVSSMQFLPSMVAAKKGADGLTYYLINVGALTVGQQFDVSLSYQKDNDLLTYSDMPVSPVEPLNDTTLGFTNLSGFLPWALGLLGLTFILGGGIWYWRTGLKIPGSQPFEVSQQRSESASQQNHEFEAGFTYCHACGKRASPGDRFCRTCGTALRNQP